MSEEQVREEVLTAEQTETEEKNEEKRRRGRRKRRDYRLTGSFPAKVVAVFLMIAGALACVAGAVICYIAADAGMYINRYETVLQEMLASQSYRIAYSVRDCLYSAKESAARFYLEDKNAEVAILGCGDEMSPDSSAFIWQSYDASEAMEENGFYSSLYVDVFMHGTAEDGEESGEVGHGEYIVRVFFDPGFVLDDDLRVLVRWTEAFYSFRYGAVLLCAGGVLVFFICFIFLLCGVGHRNGREGIVPGLLTWIPFDILTFGLILAESIVYYLVKEAPYSAYSAGVIGFCVVSVILGMIYLLDFAVRLKLGGLCRHTLIYRVMRILGRGLKGLGKLFKGLGRLLLRIPLVWVTVAVYFGICFLEVLGICCFTRIEAAGGFLWILEKIVLFLAVLYVAMVCRRLLEASRELAEGHEGYRVDTRYMFGKLREHGENLNSLGQGISRAVEERMRSERLKTELITNVSHDIKTPLTSIINYAELINHEKSENQRVQEYSEVLLRQSNRLKKLLEDLVEASKATTGNLEVKPGPCEAGVLLTQAVGEYQQKMEEKGLDLRVSQPEEPVKILADGRHLWRVFDNLLNNICKYAQENSRVYLTLEQKGTQVFIIFRNMSKYALNISPEELEERFVRGDRSRHMEGNGLGLSIAKSLTELQKGRMEIVVDGDLFKVILTFDVLN